MGETQYLCNNGNKIIFDTEESKYSCLCTFPHNYEIKGKKLNKWTIASLALLGAGVAISANKPSSMINVDDKYNDTYYLPDCIPQWIKGEFDRILELSKDEDDVCEEEENMQDQEFTFKVQNINSEKGINGKTNITLTCIQDNITFNISILNSGQGNTNLIKQKALEEHKKCAEYENKRKDYVAEGDII